MPFFVKHDKPANPLHVSLFHTQTAMLRGNAFSDLLDQFRGLVRHDTRAYKSMANAPLHVAR